MLGTPRTMVTTLLLTLAAGIAWAEETMRIPWTSSHIHGSPDPPKAFVARRIYPEVTFNRPTEVEYDPVCKCWLVLEQAGKLFALRHDDPTTKPVLCADFKAKYKELDYLYGLALHPHYAENHVVYLCYTLGPDIDDATKVSRFQMKRDEATGLPVLDIASEQVIFTWRSGGHNGANLQFGPDGMLYISTGDGASPSPPDPFNTGQDVSDLLSSILRIDVDHRDPGLAYAIPKDNPFVGKMVDSAEHKLKAARGEVWAYGVRNPWKMSFDRATGRLWCADVGWELWESVDLIERGGNYGWSAMEASQPVRADAPKPPTPIRPPVVAHSHDEAASITGGYVYHGKRFPELEGAYLYGDWATGKVWALWYDGKQVTRHEEIADTHHKIVTFGQDADGEIIYSDYNETAGFYALERNTAERTEKFPTKLSETGLYEGTWQGHMQQAPGLYHFAIKAQMLQQGTMARGYELALPGTSKILTKIVTQKDKDGTEHRSYELVWPKDAVLTREMEVFRWDGTPNGSAQRIETQMLHYDGATWNAYTYRWNVDGTDATLIPASGETEEYKDWKGNKRVWRFHSRAECIRCHNSWVGGSLAFKPEQLAGLTTYRGKTPFKHLDLLEAEGYVDEKFGKLGLFTLGSPYGLNRDEARARSFLHANCAHCHRQNAGGAVNMMLNADLPLEKMLAVGVTPQQGGLGLANPKLIDPGNPWNSVICVRMLTSGAGHMPLIGEIEFHRDSGWQVKIVEDWIAKMDPANFAKHRHAPKDEAAVRTMLGTVEGAMELRYLLQDDQLDPKLVPSMLEQAWKSPLPTVRDLFEQFKPADQREKTLGTQVNGASLLAMKGDGGHGAKVLSLQGKLGVCYACHFINGTGKDFGPDLSHVGARLSKAQILESILQPSKVIAQGFAAEALEMKDGTSYLGFVTKEEPETLWLKTATGGVEVPKAKLKKTTKLPASLMPEGQLGSLTAQEAADVLAFLEALK